MSKGYWVVEPKHLNRLMVYSKNLEFVIALYYWLIEELSIALKDQLVGVEIEVINVERDINPHGYPALGLYYETPIDPWNLEALIQATVDQLLTYHSILEFVTFLKEDGRDWNAVTAEIMHWNVDKP